MIEFDLLLPSLVTAMLQIASSGEENTWVQGPWQIPAGQSQGGQNLSFLLHWVPVARFACRAGAIALSPDGGGYSDKLWDLRSGDPTCGASCLHPAALIPTHHALWLTVATRFVRSHTHSGVLSDTLERPIPRLSGVQQTTKLDVADPSRG